MAEYIEREALKKDLLARGFFPVIVKRAIEDAPTADVVEVVRCRDCKHWGGIAFGQVCRKYSGCDTKVCTEVDHYCSYGERREK